MSGVHLGPVLVAALSAGAAAWWAVPAQAGRRVPWPDTGSRAPERRRPAGTLLLLVAAVPGVVLADVAPRVLLLGLVAGLVLVVGLALRTRRACLQASAATGDRVHEACRILADELRAGSPPVAALAFAAEASPELGDAVRAAGLGADVPTALRDAGGQLPQLRWLAAAWQVSAETGAALAASLDRLVAQLEQARSTRRVVTSELASARATARLLLGLPVVALVLASGSSPGPWPFLLDSAAGRVCLVLGLGLELAGLWWIESIAAAVEQEA